MISTKPELAEFHPDQDFNKNQQKGKIILKLGRFGCLPSNNPPRCGFPFNKGMWGKCSGF